MTGKVSATTLNFGNMIPGVQSVCQAKLNSGAAPFLSYSQKNSYQNRQIL